LNAEVDWTVGPESEVLGALRKQELDLVVGGLTEDTPWKDRVALTRPYLETQITVGVPPGQPTPNRIKGLEVAVPSGRPSVAAYVRQKGGIPVPATDLATDLAKDALPVAGDDFQLEARGLTLTGIKLHEEKHVIAVAPGENRWLMRLEQFLGGRGDWARDRLRAEAAR
jgi:hypothetical protein